MIFLRNTLVSLVALPLLVAGLFLSIALSSAAAAVVCTSDITNKAIGLEFIADTCMTDTSSWRNYIISAVECGVGTVELFAPYGDNWTTPGSLVYSLLSQGYRVFGDQYGNHIIAVHSNFGSSSIDTIDDIQMSNYAAGQFHAIFTDMILYPPAAPVDADNDHYTLCGGLDCDDNDPRITTSCTIPPPEKLDHGKPPCRFPQPQMVVDPINIFNGNTYQSASDLSFGSLETKRSYNSRGTASGMMGYGWKPGIIAASLDPDFDIDGSPYVEIIDETGRGLYFFRQDETTFWATFHETTSLARDNSDYVWLRHDGSKYRFDENGRLVQTTDPVGNFMTISYNGNNLPASITDESSGRILTFAYNAGNLIETISGPISSAVADGIWVTYGYDANNNLISVTYADGSGFTYEYNDAADIHNLTAKKDKLGRVLATWSYDDQDRAYQNTTPDGRGGSINYVSDTTVEVTDAYGETKTYTLSDHDGIKRVATVTNGSCPTCSGPSPIRYIYDANLNITEKEYNNGRIDTFSDFDSLGNPRTVIMAAGSVQEKTTLSTYHPETGNKLSSTEESLFGEGRLRETIWDYDSDGDDTPNQNPSRLLYRKIERDYTWDIAQSIIVYEDVTSYTYNDKGQVTSINGPLPGDDDLTTFTYDATTGDQLSTVYPLLGSITYGDYDGAGNVGTVLDYNNQTTSFTYDGRNRRLSTSRDGIATTTTYTLAGELESVTDGEGRTLTYSYNSAGFLDRITDEESNSIRHFYDAQGNLLEKSVFDHTDTRSQLQRFSYDNPARPGKLWKIISSDNEETVITYDSMDNRNSLTNGRGLTTTYEYDLFNRLERTLEPGDSTTIYSFDSQGNLTSVLDPEGRETAYLYDDRGNVLRTISPDSGITLYFYDQTGRLKSTTDANGTTINFTFDPLGRRTLVDFPNDPDVTLQYDQGVNGMGRLTSMIDGAANTTYEYDAQGRLTLQEAIINGRSYVTGYQYDRADNLTGMTYPGGRQVDYHPDITGRVSRVATTVNDESVNLAKNIDYLPFGPFTAMTYGNGLSLSRQFNEDLEMIGLQAGTALNRLYSHYPEGLVDTITDNIAPENTQDFLYDDLNRLTLAQGNYGFLAYGLDKTGNRLTLDQNGLPSTYGYEPATSRLTSVSGGQDIVFSLDSHGNIIARNDRVFIYNDANRLIRVETDTGEVVAEYAYNGLGQRLSKTVAANTVVFQYDLAGNLIFEESTSGSDKKEYLYLSNKRLAMITSGGNSPCSADLNNDSDVDGNDLVMFAGSGGDLSAFASQFGRSDCLQPLEDVFWYHSDHLDTPLLMTDQTGNVVWSASYTPFGMATVEVESVVNNLRFPGQYFDNETGLHYNWQRYYEPQTGRYLTTDPIGLRGGMNLYLYANANPIMFADPFGLEAWYNDPNHWTAWGFDPSNPKPLPSISGPFGPLCGPEGSIAATWIPDMFPEACREHDKCYGEEGSCKEECDAQFGESILNESGPWPNITTPFVGWIFVTIGGEDSFSRAQN